MKTWSLKVIGQTVACIVPTRFYRQSAKVDLDLWLHDPKSRVLLLSLSTIYARILKVIGQKNVVCIVPTRLYRQSAKVNLDLWPHGQKSIGFLLSSWKKRSDPVQRQKPLYWLNIPKSKATTQSTTIMFDNKRILTDIGWLDWVNIDTKLVWLTSVPFQPSHNSNDINRTYLKFAENQFI